MANEKLIFSVKAVSAEVLKSAICCGSILSIAGQDSGCSPHSQCLRGGVDAGGV